MPPKKSRHGPESATPERRAHAVNSAASGGRARTGSPVATAPIRRMVLSSNPGVTAHRGHPGADHALVDIEPASGAQFEPWRHHSPWPPRRRPCACGYRTGVGARCPLRYPRARASRARTTVCMSARRAPHMRGSARAPPVNLCYTSSVSVLNWYEKLDLLCPLTRPAVPRSSVDAVDPTLLPQQLPAPSHARSSSVPHASSWADPITARHTLPRSKPCVAR